MTETFAPRPTGKDPLPHDVTGKVFPWAGGRPVLLAMPQSDDLYLPLFSTEDELRGMLDDAGVAFKSIKQIDDADEFLDSMMVQPRIRVIMNLRPQPNGRLLFTELRIDAARR